MVVSLEEFLYKQKLVDLHSENNSEQHTRTDSQIDPINAVKQIVERYFPEVCAHAEFEVGCSTNSSQAFRLVILCLAEKYQESLAMSREFFTRNALFTDFAGAEKIKEQLSPDFKELVKINLIDV
jgi:hypothetical protein